MSDDTVLINNNHKEKVENNFVKKLTMNDFDKWLEDLVFPREVDDFIEVLYDGVKVKKMVILK
jgi:predicted MarR family transcription regulator